MYGNTPLQEPEISAPFKGKFCAQPFDRFAVLADGRVYTCCSGWLRKPIGNLKHQEIDEVLNSSEARAIRQSVLDGTYTYCDRDLCPYLKSGTLPDQADIDSVRHREIIENQLTAVSSPLVVKFSNDKSCNLTCPSCRSEAINHTQGAEYDRLLGLQRKITDYFTARAEHPVTFDITGSGDPFGSRIYRDFLTGFRAAEHPWIRINLQTNGVMLTEKMWNRIEGMHPALNRITVSFDAASEETYNVVRSGGDWKLLLQNVRFLSERRREGKYRNLRLDFVVQDLNYLEMPAFVRLAKSFGYVDKVWFSRVFDWGTWSREIFEQRAVWRAEHPQYEDFIKVLKHPDLQDRSFVKMSNLNEFFCLANQKGMG